MVKLTETTQLGKLVSEACRDRDRRRELVRQIEDQALGELADGKREEPENMAFATAALLLPMMLQDPRVRCSSGGDYTGRFTAVAAQSSANQLLAHGSVRDVFQTCAWDYTFGWTALFAEAAETQRSDPTDSERASMGGDWASGIASPQGPSMPSQRIRPEWPALKYIHPDMFFHDTKVRTKGEWAFVGHVNVESKPALIERAEADPKTWHVDEVKAIPTTSNTAQLNYAMAIGSRAVERDQVVYFIVYEPHGVIEGQDPKPWEYGVIRTIAPRGGAGVGGGAQMDSAVEIRKPYYYRGHPDGPYVHAGQYTNTRESFPMTGLMANWKSVEMLNAAASSLYQRIREHSIKFAYDAAQHDSIERLRLAPDGDWVPIANLKDNAIQTIETGGPSVAEVRELALLQARVAAALAMDDVERGKVDGDATATAIRQVAATTAKRSSQLIRNWRTFVSQACERVVAHIVSSERFFIRLDETGRDDHRRAVLEAAAPILARATNVDLPSGELEGMIERTRPIGLPMRGGDFSKTPSAWWDLKIDVHVSEATDVGGPESLMREQSVNDTLAWFAQRMIDQPHVNWKQRAKEHFAAIGAPGMERLLDEQRASALVQMQLASVEPSITTETEAGGRPQTPDIIPGGSVLTGNSKPSQGQPVGGMA